MEGHHPRAQGTGLQGGRSARPWALVPSGNEAYEQSTLRQRAETSALDGTRYELGSPSTRRTVYKRVSHLSFPPSVSQSCSRIREITQLPVALFRNISHMNSCFLSSKPPNLPLR